MYFQEVLNIIKYHNLEEKDSVYSTIKHSIILHYI